MNPARSLTLPLWLLTFIACVAAFKVGAGVLAPIVLALVIGVVLSPLSRRIDRLGAPPAAGAFLTLFAMLLLIVGLFTALEPVLSEALERAPQIMDEVREIITNIRSAMQGLDNVSAEVAEAMTDDAAVAAEVAAPATAEVAQPVADEGEAIELPSMTDALFYAPGFVATVMVFVATLYFFLLSRREVYGWIAGSPAVPLGIADLLEAEREVSRYFLTITLINAGLGLLVTGMLVLYGMPYAVLWGFGAFLLNYVLYIGPAGFAVGLLLAGLVAFDGPLSFAPAATYVFMNAIEGQFVTPSLVGRQMSVNPLLVFLSLVTWLWIWGPIGGVVAIPLLVWAMVLIKRGHAAQTISSGTPGRLRPNLLATAEG